jgi:hypothetical protein
LRADVSGVALGVEAHEPADAVDTLCTEDLNLPDGGQLRKGITQLGRSGIDRYVTRLGAIEVIREATLERIAHVSGGIQANDLLRE